MRAVFAICGIFASLSCPSIAQDHHVTREGIAEIAGKAEFSPYVGRDFPTQVLWGDTHEAKRFGVRMSADVPMTTTERAYTSPIRYTP